MSFYWGGRYWMRPWDTRWHDPNSTASVTVLTPPATEPLSLVDARDHLRLIASEVGSPPDLVHPDDGFLTGYAIGAAREYCEQMVGRALAPQRFELRLDAFPFAYPGVGPWHVYTPHGSILLPMAAPLIQVESVTYTDGDGNSVDMAEGVDYLLRARGEPARLYPITGATWPTAKQMPEAVRIIYSAGYGSTGDEFGSPSGPTTAALPYLAAAGIRLMLGHLYENREEVVVGQRVVSIQLSTGVAALLAPLNVETGVA